jgi:hypothetical protein
MVSCIPVKRAIATVVSCFEIESMCIKDCDMLDLPVEWEDNISRGYHIEISEEAHGCYKGNMGTKTLGIDVY